MAKGQLRWLMRHRGGNGGGHGGRGIAELQARQGGGTSDKGAIEVAKETLGW